jgi:DNA-directed RNA polymerase subunit D
MEIEIIEMAERKAKFVLKNSSPAMANALRRTLLSDIPKMAIDKVEFHLGPIMYEDKEYESVTPLFDEIIAHRLGMVPVPTLDEFVPRDECSCEGEGCPSCDFMYSLNKIGPCTVLSGDLMPLGNPEMKVKDEYIPIVELTDGQAVMIYAHAVMGTAKKHVKWQVANGVGYKYMPHVEIDPKHDKDEALVAIAEKYPDGLSVKGGKVTVKSDLDCGIKRGCIEALSECEGVTITWDDSNFIFQFETDGSLTAEQTLAKAREILAKEAQDFKDQIRNLS